MNPMAASFPPRCETQLTDPMYPTMRVRPNKHRKALCQALIDCRRRLLLPHQPRPTGSRGDLPGGPHPESPLQVLDHLVDGMPILFFDPDQLAQARGSLEVTLGLRADDRLAGFVGPLLDLPAVLHQQTQQVLGLSLVGGAGRSGGRLDPGGMGAGSAPSPIGGSAGPQTSDILRVARNALVGQTGEVHLFSQLDV